MKIAHTEAEVQAIAATWQNHAPPEAQIAFDAGQERGERWARFDTAPHYHNSEWTDPGRAGSGRLDCSVANAEALRFCYGSIRPEERRDGASVGRLVRDIIDFVEANPEQYAPRGWGTRFPDRRLERDGGHLSAQALKRRIRYRLDQISNMGDRWGAILMSANIAVDGAQYSIWSGIWQVFDPQRYADGGYQRLWLIGMVGAAVARRARPPSDYATWQDAIDGTKKKSDRWPTLQPGVYLGWFPGQEPPGSAAAQSILDEDERAVIRLLERQEHALLNASNIGREPPG